MKKIKNHRIKLFRLFPDKMRPMSCAFHLVYPCERNLFFQFCASSKRIVFAVNKSAGWFCRDLWNQDKGNGNFLKTVCGCWCEKASASALHCVIVLPSLNSLKTWFDPWYQMSFGSISIFITLSSNYIHMRTFFVIQRFFVLREYIWQPAMSLCRQNVPAPFSQK